MASKSKESHFCIYRDESSFGSLKCSCQTSPSVYKCNLPWNASGYCTPDNTRTKDEFPPDGPIVPHKGDKIVPAESRMRGFVAWPLKADEPPQLWQVINCQSCPKRIEPPRHVLKLRELGIRGHWDRGTGETDILYILNHQEEWAFLQPCSPGKKASFITNSREPFAEAVSLTRCQLLVLIVDSINIEHIKAAIAANPNMKVWICDSPIPKRQAVKPSELPGVAYGLDDSTSKALLEQRRDAYRQRIKQLLT